MAGTTTQGMVGGVSGASPPAAPMVRAACTAGGGERKRPLGAGVAPSTKEELARFEEREGARRLVMAEAERGEGGGEGGGLADLLGVVWQLGQQ